MSKVRLKVKAVSPYPVNILLRKGIRMRQIKYDKGWDFSVQGQDKANALKNLCNFSVEVAEEKGFFLTLKNLLGRIGFISATVAVTLLLAFYSFCTLNIEIKGIKNLDEKFILDSIDEYAVVPSFNRNLDTKAMERQLMGLKGISSASVKKVGTTLKIEVLEELPKTAPEDILWSMHPLTSKYDAIVTRVIPRYGTVLVKQNDTVRKGQELIMPYRESESGERTETKAGGEIYGRVWLKKSVIFHDFVLSSVRTGEKSVLTEVKGFENIKKITAPYANYEMEVRSYYIGGALLPLKVTETTYHQTEGRLVPFDFEANREALTAQHTRELEEEIPDGAIKGRTWSTVKRLDNSVELVIYYEIEINIIG